MSYNVRTSWNHQHKLLLWAELLTFGFELRLCPCSLWHLWYLEGFSSLEPKSANSSLSSSLFCSECGGSFGELRFQTETLKASPGSTSTNSFSKNPMKQEHFCPLPATTLTPAGGGAAAPVQDRKTSIFNSNEAAWKTRTVTAAKRTDSSERMSPSSTLRQDEQQIHRNPTNDNQQDNQHFFKLN